jgi:predicted Rossmann-fold nucleotide-binding protein
MKIAIFGSAIDSSAVEYARIAGKRIAERDACLLTGGCGGIPGAATDSAIIAGGKVMIYSPGRDMDEHMRFGEPVFKGDWSFVPESYPLAGNKQECFKYRNISMVSASDGCIIIGGRIGTLNEFTISYDLGKVIGILERSGGTSGMIPAIVEMANKDSHAKLLYSDNASRLADMVIEEIKRRK